MNNSEFIGQWSGKKPGNFCFSATLRTGKIRCSSVRYQSSDPTGYIPQHIGSRYSSEGVK